MEFKMDGIFMTAVDTGWCTDERPFAQAEYERREAGFVVPLDCEDGAARVLHPVLQGLSGSNLTEGGGGLRLGQGQAQGHTDCDGLNGQGKAPQGREDTPFFAVFLKDFKVHPW